MPWAALEDDFHSHPKVIAAGLNGAGLFARALSYCAHYLTDGHVPREWAHGPGGPKLARKLVQVGLWVETDTGYWIRDYTELNPTREHVEKQRSELAQKRAESGRKGAEKRWQKTRDLPSPEPSPPADLPSGLPSVCHSKSVANACPPTPTPPKTSRGVGEGVGETAASYAAPEPAASPFQPPAGNAPPRTRHANESIERDTPIPERIDPAGLLAQLAAKGTQPA